MNSSKKKRKTIIIILLVALLYVFAACAAFSGFHKYHPIIKAVGNASSLVCKTGKTLDDSGSAIKGQMSSQTTSQVLAELKKKQVVVTDKVSSSIVFASGKKCSTGSWAVENAAKNNVIMQCEVYLNNNLIAKSVPIYPGQHIENINLLKDTGDGTFDVVAFIDYFNLRTKSYISRAGYKIKMVVQQ